MSQFYAVIETGGKQYRAAPGEVLFVEKLEATVGEKLTFDKVLLVGSAAEGQTLVGTPFVEKATLEAEIVEHMRGDKIRTIKYRRRKGYRRTMGHRQSLTKILITKVADGKGATSEFDVSKRAEVLQKANVRLSANEPAAKAAAPKAPKAAKAATAAKNEAKTKTTRAKK